MAHYREGNEKGVYWYLDWKGDSIVIHAEKESNKEEFLEEEYKFQYLPIFGFDVSDVAYVEKKLDDYINKLSL
jgi:hypothetical protein